MSGGRYIKARDENEAPIVERLESHGYVVERTDLVDLIVQSRTTGGTCLLEVKTHEGSLTPRQKALRQRGLKFTVVRTPVQALVAAQTLVGRP